MVSVTIFCHDSLTMRIHRDQYIELMTFGEAERPLFAELFGPLVGLEDEWRTQGAAPDELDMTAFDWDFVPYADCGAEFGVFGAPPPRVLEETDELRIERDALGRTLKLNKRAATIPLPLDYPVKSMDDWLRLKPFFAFREDRVDAAAVARARRAREEGAVIRAAIPGGWDTARELMGEEVACLAYYEQPELMRNILDTLSDTCRRVFELLADQVIVDQLSIHEDMAGKSGPLVGPNLVGEFIAPFYRATWEAAAARGARLFNQDSDGDMTCLLDLFVEHGVNMMHPFEPAAGMDIVKVRKRFGPRLAMLGGIDKFVLRGTRDEIRRELEYKMQDATREGGTVFGLDHRIPGGTPLENYRFYVATGREILDLPPLDGRRKGWGRMAF